MTFLFEFRKVPDNDCLSNLTVHYLEDYVPFILKVLLPMVQSSDFAARTVRRMGFMPGRALPLENHDEGTLID